MVVKIKKYFKLSIEKFDFKFEIPLFNIRNIIDEKIKKLKMPDSTKTLNIPTSIIKNLFSLIKLKPEVVILGPIPNRKS